MISTTCRLVPLLLNPLVMRAALGSIVLVFCASGCLYGKLLDAYSSALGLNSQPASTQAAPVQAAPAPTEEAAPAPAEQAVAEAPPEPQPYVAEPAPPQPQPVVYAPTYVHSTSNTNVTSNVTSTVNYVNAAPQGAPAWIALYPAARGSSQTMCKRFSGAADNHNACSSECNHQMRFGPGSCSCMDMDSCPQGTRIVP